MRQQYQIQNITRRPKPVNGPDTRTMTAKRGHYVSYRNHQDKVVMLRPDEVKIINEPGEDIYNLVSQGYLACWPLKDIADALSQHTAPSRRKKPAADTETDAQLADAAQRGRTARQGRASMMGETQDVRGVTELEGAVNPDGNPNFTVTATKNSVPKRQRQR